MKKKAIAFMLVTACITTMFTACGKGKDSDTEAAATVTPLQYSMEKFFDDGYTVGVAGLKKNSAGKYQFDIRVGTKLNKISLPADIHLFVSAETYLMKDFDYITDQIIRINIPEYMTTGYYECNGAGVFRYLKEETDYKDLLPGDYNDTIYVYDNKGNSITGSKDGLVLDNDGYLVTANQQYENDNQEQLDKKGEHDYTPIDGDDIDSYFQGTGKDVIRDTDNAESTQSGSDSTETVQENTGTEDPQNQ